jgi:putative Mg2+ transporter-C (MgtC) family protein
MILNQEELIRLLVALLVGGIIGLEREFHAKTAGFRTITLITVGATLFTIISFYFSPDDPGRLAANIVVGIGFLGAGAILLSEGKVKGLTTASSIWVAAALGMAIGVGEFILAAIGTLVVILVLWLLSPIDRLIDVIGREVRTYEVTYILSQGRLDEIERRITLSGLQLLSKHQMKVGENRLQGHWELRGPLARHNQFTESLLGDEDILEVRY